MCTGPLVAIPAHADDSAANMTVTGTFTPSLERPGYPSTTSPYATTLGIVFDRTSQSLITLDIGTPAWVAAYDSATLRPRAGSGKLLDGAITAVLSDPRSTGVTVAVATAPFQPTTAIEQLQVVRGHVVVARRTDVSTQLTPRQTVVGIASDPSTGMLFTLGVEFVPVNGAPTPVPGTVEVALVDPASAKVLWRQNLPNCNLPMMVTAGRQPAPQGLSAPIGVVKSPHVVDVGCSAQSAGGGVGLAKFPVPLGVGVVHLSGKGTGTTFGGFDLDPYPGDATTYPSGVWIPSVDRMAFQVQNTINGSGWVIFDGRHSDYVGTVPLPQAALQVGADPAHGRLYLLGTVSSTGLVASDAGVTPADQGHDFPQFAGDPINEDNNLGQAPVAGALAVDPPTGRVFLLYGGSHKFVVVRDDNPYYVTPPAPDVDANTAGIPEVSGKTGANYSGSMQGYGSVMRQVGGEVNLQYNYVPVGINGPERGTRSYATSWIQQGALANSEAQASLMTAVVDQGNTGTQLSGQGVTWPYKSATCADLGNNQGSQGGDGSGVKCDANGAAVSGSVAAGSSSVILPADKSSGQSVPEVFGVGSSSLKMSSTAEQGKGMTTEVHASASGISILGGMLKIGEVTADATAHANGQTGGAKATLTRELHNVVVQGTQLCGAQCNLDTVIKTINSELVGHVRVSTPDPDQTLLGSPGGYQALIRRNPYSQAEESSLNDQPGVRGEVPGLQITVYEDNSESSRTVIYLAGTEVEAHYGVYEITDSGCACPPPPPGHGGGGTTGPTSLPSTPPLTLSYPNGGKPPVVAGGTNVGAFLKHGWEFLLTGLGDALHQFGVWAILLLPIYLSARRWALANRHDTTGGST